MTPGRITPRTSWPRTATPCTLRPAWAGEFKDFNDWVRFASQRLTGGYDPASGVEVPAVCIDAKGRRCTMGLHFARARDENAFPVRFFWDCNDDKDHESTLRGQGMVVAAGLIAHHDPVYAEEILNTCGWTTLEELIAADCDGYAIRQLATVLDAIAARKAKGVEG